MKMPKLKEISKSKMLNKKMLITFMGGLILGIGLVIMFISLQHRNAKTEMYAIGAEIRVRGMITDKEDPLKGNIDGPKKLTVKLDNEETITTNYYCGYTRTVDAVVADKDMEVGDRIEIFGVYEMSSFIKVCNEKYSIRKV